MSFDFNKQLNIEETSLSLYNDDDVIACYNKALTEKYGLKLYPEIIGNTESNYINVHAAYDIHAYSLNHLVTCIDIFEALYQTVFNNLILKYNIDISKFYDFGNINQRITNNDGQGTYVSHIYMPPLNVFDYNQCLYLLGFISQQVLFQLIRNNMANSNIIIFINMVKHQNHVFLDYDALMTFICTIANNPEKFKYLYIQSTFHQFLFQSAENVFQDKLPEDMLYTNITLIDFCQYLYHKYVRSKHIDSRPYNIF